MGLWTALPGIAYDEAAERTVVSGFGRLATYDATSDRWEILLEADPGGSLPLLTVYDRCTGGSSAGASEAAWTGPSSPST